VLTVYLYSVDYNSGEVDVQNHFVLMSMLAEKWQKSLVLASETFWSDTCRVFEYF
jgi:hypothetical protein